MHQDAHETRYHPQSTEKLSGHMYKVVSFLFPFLTSTATEIQASSIQGEELKKRNEMSSKMVPSRPMQIQMEKKT